MISFLKFFRMKMQLAIFTEIWIKNCQSSFFRGKFYTIFGIDINVKLLVVCIWFFFLLPNFTSYHGYHLIFLQFCYLSKLLVRVHLSLIFFTPKLYQLPWLPLNIFAIFLSRYIAPDSCFVGIKILSSESKPSESKRVNLNEWI